MVSAVPRKSDIDHILIPQSQPLAQQRVLDDDSRPLSVRHGDVDLAAVLGVPFVRGQIADDDRFILDFHGQVQKILGGMVSGSEKAAHIPFIPGFDSVFGQGDRIGRQIVRPVVQLTVEHDLPQGIGQSDRPAVCIAMIWEKDQNCG